MTADAMAALHGCTQLAHQLFYYLDEARYADLVALFGATGKWHRQGEILVGPEQIMQALLKRPATQRVRHIVSNSLIESQADDLVRHVCYMTAYRFDDGATHAGPVPISRPFRLSVVRSTMRRTGTGWNIDEMVMTPEFEFVSERASAEDRQ